MTSRAGSARGSRNVIEVDVESVTVRYGRHRALDGVSFDWANGVLGVTGSNGSGKSTLLRVLVGSVRAAAGDVLFTCGDDVLSRRDIRIGFVPQSFEFAGAMTVFDFVEYAAWLQRVEHPRQSAERAIRDVGLEPQAKTRLGRASGGMVRRAGLAAALVGCPDLLVLDEPTTGIDPEQRSLIRTLLQQQAQERAVIFSSHIAEDLEQVCPTVLILDGGQVAFFGSADDAKAAAHTASFESAIVELPKLRRIGL